MFRGSAPSFQSIGADSFGSANLKAGVRALMLRRIRKVSRKIQEIDAIFSLRIAMLERART